MSNFLNQTIEETKEETECVLAKNLSEENTWFTALDEGNQKNSKQLTSYARYRYSDNPSGDCTFKTKAMEVTMGIDPFNPDWHDSEYSRSVCKIGFNLEKKGDRQALQAATRIDNSAVNHKQDIFGDKAAAYQYYPLVRYRKPKASDDNIGKIIEEEEEKGTPYIKARFDTVWVDEKVRDQPNEHGQMHGDIKTTVIIKTLKQGCTKGDKSIPEREKYDIRTVPVTTLEQLEKLHTYKSEVEYVIKVNKVWINKAKATGSKFRLYGTSLKILQLVIQPRESGFKRSSFKTYRWDPESDDEDDEVKTTEQVTADEVKTTEQVTADEEDEPSDVDEPSDEEDEPSDVDEPSDEEDEPSDVDEPSDDEDEPEEEEVVVKKPTKKKVKKPRKKKST